MLSNRSNAVANFEPICTPLQRLLAVLATSTVFAESTYDLGLDPSFSNVRAVFFNNHDVRFYNFKQLLPIHVQRS